MAKKQTKKAGRVEEYVKNHMKEEDSAAKKAVGGKLRRTGRWLGHVAGKSYAGAIGGGAVGGAIGAAAGPVGMPVGASLGGMAGSIAGTAHGARSFARKEESLRRAARVGVRVKKLKRAGKVGAAIAGTAAAGTAAVKGAKAYLDHERKKDSSLKKTASVYLEEFGGE